MKIYYFSISIIIYLLSITGYSANTHKGISKIDEAILVKAKDLTLNRDYNEVILLLENEIVKNREEPLYPFTLSVVYQIMMFEGDNYDYESQYKSLNNKVISLLNAIKNKSPWNLLVEGSAYGSLGLHELRRHNRLRSISYGLKAIKLINKAKSIDQELYETYMPLGMYVYIRSRLSIDHFWLPFFKDRREEGINQIKRAKQFSNIIREPSSFVLSLIYKKEKNWPKLIKEVTHLTEKYPNCIMSYLLLFYAYVNTEKFDLAQKNIEKVLSIKQDYYLAEYLKGFLLFKKTNRIEEAKVSFLTSYRKSKDDHLRALSAYQLSSIYEKENNDKLKKKYKKIAHQLDSKIDKDELEKIKIFN